MSYGTKKCVKDLFMKLSLFISFLPSNNPLSQVTIMYTIAKSLSHK